MSILLVLIPLSLSLGLLGLMVFVWTLKSKQYEDPEGDAMRILDDSFDEQPKAK